ncbi:AbrB/MazE/SpoVT family DNA-binding domain-containing protein [candidate division KSB1 bacterium]|nr:AbrB/MazE/SpoVT family DNA-binding domain-containing protein [candidate division KSB1 bacterium]MBL7093398.1 AbrB/MazE/SpoVT family DNA-binding domain-containing protein [candidate division KSB1 bacterium]
MLTSTITQKGQITIPPKIRKYLKLEANDQVVFIQRGENIFLKPVKNILDIRSSVKVDGKQNFFLVRKQTRTKVAYKIANE